MLDFQNDSFYVTVNECLVLYLPEIRLISWLQNVSIFSLIWQIDCFTSLTQRGDVTVILSVGSRGADRYWNPYNNKKTVKYI